MATGLLVALLLIVTLLAVPLTLRFHIRWDQALSSRVRLQWAFGLVRCSLDRPKEQTPLQRNKRTGKSSSSKLNIGKALRQKTFRQRLQRFIGDLWRVFKKREMKLHLRVGLGDPAATGQLWALLGPVGVMLGNLPDAEITIEPEFIEQALELETSGNVRVIPLQLLGVMLALLVSPALWLGIRLARR